MKKGPKIQVFAQRLGIIIPAEKLSGIEEKYEELLRQDYDFYLAEATLHLFLLRQLDQLPDFFRVARRKLFDEYREGSPPCKVSEATIQLSVKGEPMHVVADSDAPVQSLDAALRKALCPTYPALTVVELVDFHMDLSGTPHGAASVVSAILRFADNKARTWVTTTHDVNYIYAAWEALLDGYRYELLFNGKTSH